MTDYRPDNLSEESVEETRRKKLEEFNRTFDRNAIRGAYDSDEAESLSAPSRAASDYGDEDDTVRPYFSASSAASDYADDSSSVSYSSDDAPLRRRRKADEINSFSNYDTKKRIERDSKKALKEQKKEEKRIEKSKAKRNRRVFKLVWLSMILIVAIMLSQFVVVGMNDMLGASRSDNVRTVKINVPAAPTFDVIADILYQNGIISNPQFFKMYAKATTKEEYFSQGEFVLETNKDYEAIINELQSEDSRTDFEIVQITEGMSVWEIANLLRESEVITDTEEFSGTRAFLDLCNSDEFDEDFPFLADVSVGEVRNLEIDGAEYADAYKLEGYLFPDTYYFYKGNEKKNIRSIIYKMLDNYEDKVLVHREKYFGNAKKSTLAAEAEKSGYTLREILTIASIIQAEAANKDDMYTISSILHNRLKYGAEYGVAKLNCDCTVYYPWRSASDVPEVIRTAYSSRYNTNNFNGLPPGPICNPGTEAIKAALNPYDTDYLYFCHDKPENGATPYYAETLEQHNENLRTIGK